MLPKILESEQTFTISPSQVRQHDRYRIAGVSSHDEKNRFISVRKEEIEHALLTPMRLDFAKHELLDAGEFTPPSFDYLLALNAYHPASAASA